MLPSKIFKANTSYGAPLVRCNATLGMEMSDSSNKENEGKNFAL